MKYANTHLSMSMVSAHVGTVPVQSPPQLANDESVSGVAVSVTFVPGWNCTVQFPMPFCPSPRQSMPGGALVTFPLPATVWSPDGSLPYTYTVRIQYGAVKLATTWWSASIVRVHVAFVPSQSAPHPMKFPPGPCVAL